MSEFWGNSALLVARIALSLIYLWAGTRKILNWSSTSDYMKVKQVRGISLLLPVAVALQILGGISLVLGLYTHIGALLLILFTLPATITMHNFWSLSGRERIQEQSHFLKDIAIIGGLILLLITGPGKYSLA